MTKTWTRCIATYTGTHKRCHVVYGVRLSADTVDPASSRRSYCRRGYRQWLSKWVPDGLGTADLRHLGHAIHLRRSNHRANLSVFAHLSGGLAQRAIQPYRVTGAALVVQPRWRDRWWRQSTGIDDGLQRQAEDRQIDAGRRRQLHCLLRAVLRGTNVGRVGWNSAVWRWVQRVSKSAV